MSEFRSSYSNSISAAPDVVIALTYLITWIAPATFGDHMVEYLVVAVLLEMISPHASVILGGVLMFNITKTKKIVLLFSIGAFFTMFIGIFASFINEWWPIIGFWVLIMNRLMSVVLGKTPDGGQFLSMVNLWVIGCVCYYASMILSFIVPFPELGVTAGFVASLHSAEPIFQTDWLHRWMAFGFLYYFLIALAELNISTVVRWFKLPDVDKLMALARRRTNPPE